MAGGIDWFRWHHGSVTDPKFKLVAKKAGARVADVLAVWACLLEAASMSEERGNPGTPDFEALDCALELDDGASAAIYVRMQERGLLGGDGDVAAWEKRQPKREREDDTAAERKRRQREREAAASATGGDTPPEATDSNVTPCHATSHQKTPREEKRREEQRKEKDPPTPRKRGKGFDAAGIELPEWLEADLWQRWCRFRAEIGKAITEEGARAQLAQLDKHRSEGRTPRDVLEHAIASGHQGLYPPAKATNGHGTRGAGTSYAERMESQAIGAGVLIGAIRRPVKPEPLETFDVPARIAS